MKKKIVGELARYLLPSMLAVMGTSLYILADTFFIAKAEGSNGIAALNLVLPLYSITYGVGGMIGIGSATRYSLQKARGSKDIDFYFSNAIMWNLCLSLLFALIFGFFTEPILRFLGADAVLLQVGIPYMRTAMILSPFTMVNSCFVAFIRNDHNPKLAMVATLFSGLFNIVMDWWLMFPMRLGMLGAALATAIAPMVSMSICSLHFWRKENHLYWIWRRPSISKLFRSMSLGLVVFIGEMASGMTTMVFNFVLLGLGGNITVAAYGIVANCALVIIAIYNGIAQGLQPLASHYFGSGKKEESQKVYQYSLLFGLLLTAVLVGITFMFTEELVAVFNEEGSLALAQLAQRGTRLYFIGFFLAVINVVQAGYYSAIGLAKESFVISMLRGTALICLFALILPKLIGVDGVWLSFLSAELGTVLISYCLVRKSYQKELLDTEQREKSLW